VPGGPRGDVGERPGRLELQRGLVVHGQEVHEVGQQTADHDLLQQRVLLLGEQLPGGERSRTLPGPPHLPCPPEWSGSLVWTLVSLRLVGGAPGKPTISRGPQ